MVFDSHKSKLNKRRIINQRRPFFLRIITFPLQNYICLLHISCAMGMYVFRYDEKHNKLSVLRLIKNVLISNRLGDMAFISGNISDCLRLDRDVHNK